MSTRKARQASAPQAPHYSTTQKQPNHNHAPSHQAHASISDSETPFDAIPAPPSRSNAELNLHVLKRHYPSTLSILSLAPYAVLYTFNATNSAWEKSGIEGTLFVCSLYPPTSTPQHQRFAVTILNRRGLDNFWLELTKGEEVEVSDEYIILQALGQDGVDMVYGLWVFEEESGSTRGMRERMAGLIRDCAERAEASNAESAANGTLMIGNGEEEGAASMEQARQYSQLEAEYDEAKEELEWLRERKTLEQREKYEKVRGKLEELQRMKNEQQEQQQAIEALENQRQQQRYQDAIQQQGEYDQALHNQQPFYQNPSSPFQPHPRHFQQQPQAVPQPPPQPIYQQQPQAIHQPIYQPQPTYQPPPQPIYQPQQPSQSYQPAYEPPSQPHFQPPHPPFQPAQQPPSQPTYPPPGFQPPPPQPAPAPTSSAPSHPQPLFQPSADTQFFLSAPRHPPPGPRQQQQSAPQPIPAQNDILGQLFAKAKGEMRGAAG